VPSAQNSSALHSPAAKELPAGISASHSLSTKSTLGIQRGLPELPHRILGQEILVNLQDRLAEKNFAMAKPKKQAPVITAAIHADRGSPRFSACLAVAYQMCAAGNPKLSSAPFLKEAPDVNTQNQKTADKTPTNEPKIWAPNRSRPDTSKSRPSF
jgi:hypothetical protein